MNFNSNKLIFKILEKVTALISLTESYSPIFENFKQPERNEFFIKLQEQLCQIIPVSKSQLNFTKKFIKDSQIQLALTINNDDNGRSVNSIIKDLDTLIRNREITQISIYDPAKYLDKSYGCKPTRKIIMYLIDFFKKITYLFTWFIYYIF